MPSNPDVEHAYWTPYLVFGVVGLLAALGGYGLSVLTSNPTWFIQGVVVFLVSLIALVRGVVCMNR